MILARGSNPSLRHTVPVPYNQTSSRLSTQGRVPGTGPKNVSTNVMYISDIFYSDFVECYWWKIECQLVIIDSDNCERKMQIRHLTQWW